MLLPVISACTFTTIPPSATLSLNPSIFMATSTKSLAVSFLPFNQSKSHSFVWSLFSSPSKESGFGKRRESERTD